MKFTQIKRLIDYFLSTFFIKSLKGRKESMSRYLKILFYLLLVAFLLSCEKPVQVDTVHNLNPLNETLVVQKHFDYVEMLVEEGMSKEEADHEALQIQLAEVAILTKAKDLGIKVSNEEALTEARKMKELVEQGKIENAEEISAKINKVMIKFGITAEQYWEEFIINSYKQMLFQHKLMDYEKSLNPNLDWNMRHKEIIDEYKQREANEIEKFKRKLM